MTEELREEMRFYLEMRARELIDEGVDPEEAERRALEAFGDPREIEREVMRMEKGSRIREEAGSSLWSIVADAKYAARFLLGHRGFTAVVLGTLALGIGANTAIFSVLHGVLLKAPGVEDPSSLVAVYTTSRRGFPRSSSSWLDYVDYRDRTGALADLAATTQLPATLGDDERGARAVTVEAVTDNTFGLLGVRPALGRPIGSDDDRFGAGRAVTVLSHRLWTGHFGGDPSIVGTSVRLSGQPFEVVGVMGPEYTGLTLGDGPDLWTSMQAARAVGTGFAIGDDRMFEIRGARWIGRLVGRLAPGTTVEAARAELLAVSDRLREEDPDARGPRSVTVDPLGRYLLPVGEEEDLSAFVWLLMGVVGTTLLLASANLANLLLARASTRRGEIGVRLALGASRGRVVRQLLTESLLLGIGGGALGLLVAIGLLQLLGGFDLPGGLPIAAVRPELNGPVLATTAALSLLTALLFGLAPAMRSTRDGLASSVREHGGRGGARQGNRLRGALVTAQIALCLMLLIGSGLFLRTLQNALGADIGIDARSVAATRFNLGGAGYDDTRGEAFVDRLRAELQRLPGVRSVAVATLVPFQGGGFRGTFFTVDDYQPAEDEELRVDLVYTTPGFPEAVGMELLEGRDFTLSDGSGAPNVTIVNRAMAERYWPDGTALGGTLRIGDEELSVVGVAEDVRWGSLDEEPTNFMFVPLAQTEVEGSGGLTAVVRASGDPAELLGPMRASLRGLDPEVSPSMLATMDELLSGVLMPQRLGAALLTGFGLLALVLGIVGVVGVVSYRVRAERRALGVRIALGADRGHVRRLVLGGIAGPVLLGIALGIVGGAALRGTLEGFLFEVSSGDPLTYAVMAVGLAALALGSSLLPAREAGRVDPVQVLRAD